MICDLSSLIDVDIGGIDVPIINAKIVSNNTESDLGTKEIVLNPELDELNEAENLKDQDLSLIGELDAETGQNQHIEEFNGPIAVKNSELDSGMEEVISNSKLDELIGVENLKDGSLELESEIMQDESNLDKVNRHQLNNSIDVSLIGELDEKTDQNQQIEENNNNNNELDLGKGETISSSKFDQLNEVENSKDEFLGVGNENTQDQFHLEKLNQDNSINIVADFEEGEIEDEVQLLEQELDIENNVDLLNNNKLEVDLVNNTNTNLGFGNKEENIHGLIDQFDKNNNEFIISDSDCNKGGKKRKRVLTKERKAKKKKVSRIKRAKKLREDGVHRLRIPLAIKKEKEQKICKFFLNGRCQQGDKCKFSHDAVPLTKSKPCNHFARGECLKGDECPYDHNLQKYPCHKFISEGFCNRGPNCKFSHSIQAKEDSLPDNNNISSPKISLVQKIIIKPTIIPKGIKFLSFKKDPIITSDKTGSHNEESNLLDLEKSGISNPEFCSSSSNLLKVRNEAVCGEVSEASKILQEFLFSALSPFN